MFKWGRLYNLFKSKSQNKNNKILPTGRTFQEQIQHDYQKALENEKKSTNPKFHRTPREENLSDNFYNRHHAKVNILEENLYQETNKIHSLFDIDERIDQCKKAIKAYNDLKKFCTSKGKGGSIYFEDMWEHCHNSKNHDFRFIEWVENELNYLINNYNVAKEELARPKNKREDDSHD